MLPLTLGCTGAALPVASGPSLISRMMQLKGQQLGLFKKADAASGRGGSKAIVGKDKKQQQQQQQQQQGKKRVPEDDQPTHAGDSTGAYIWTCAGLCAACLRAYVRSPVRFLPVRASVSFGRREAGGGPPGLTGVLFFLLWHNHSDEVFS